VAKARFEWDAQKDRENQRKHGVSFAMAQFAFAAPNRVIAEDLSHSSDEARHYCFGVVEGGVLTVRFHISRRHHPNLRGGLLAKG
jgi:hypothetical protein